MVGEDRKVGECLEYDSPTGELSNKPKNIIFEQDEAKLREISVNECCTSKHCEADRPVATGGQH